MAYDKHRRVTLQSAATATGNGTYLDVAGFGGAQLQLTGTFTATVTFEATIDLQNWVTQEVVDTNGVRQTTGTAAGIFKANTAGLAAIRARISAYTSGSVTCEGICIPDAVTYDAPGTGGSSDQIQGAAADGAAVTGNPVLCGGQDGTNAQSLLTDTSGRQIVIGAAADGAAVAGNPLLIAGQDGTNAQSLLTDSSGSLIPGTGATNLGKAIDTAVGATDTGVAPLAQRDDALSALTPVEGDYVPLRVDANGALWTSISAALPAGANLIGDVGAAGRATGGGTSIYSAAVTTAAAVKASAGQVYGLNIYNGSGAPAWLQIFDTAAAGVTLGTTAPVYSIGVPQAANASWTPPVPIVHSTAIAVGSTVSRAGTTTASMDVNIVYA